MVTEGSVAEVRIDTDLHKTMKGTGPDRVVEALVEEGNHEYVARVQNTQRTVAPNHLPRGTKTIEETIHALPVALVVDMVVEARIIWKGMYQKRVFHY